MIKTSTLTPHQLSLLDGRITKREKAISDYCSRVLAKNMPPLDLPEDLTPECRPLALRLAEFLLSSARVLLLQAPTGAGKSLVSKHVAAKAHELHNFVPIFVALDAGLLQTPERLVEAALLSEGLDSATILQAQETHTFLIIVEGYDSCGLQTNLYVRGNFHRWPGKVIFTCRSSYIENAPYGWFYFMPQAANKRADPSGLASIRFTTALSKPNDQNDSPTATGDFPIYCLILTIT